MATTLLPKPIEEIASETEEKKEIEHENIKKESEE